MISRHIFSKTFSLPAIQTLKVWGDENLITSFEVPDDPIPTGDIYYFAEDGNDLTGVKNNKLLPFKSLDKMYALAPTLNNGDGILFAMGDEFKFTGGSPSRTGGITGTELNPLVFSRYWKTGDEANTNLPILSGGAETTYSWTQVDTDGWGNAIWESNGCPSNRTRMLMDGIEQVRCETRSQFDTYEEVKVWQDTSLNKLVYRGASPVGSVWKYATKKNIFTFEFAEHIIFNGLETEWTYSGGTTLNMFDSKQITIQNCILGGWSSGAVSLAGNWLTRGIDFVVTHNTFDTKMTLDYNFGYISSSDGMLIHNTLNFSYTADNSVFEHNRVLNYGHAGVYYANMGVNKPEGVGGVNRYNLYSAPGGAYARPLDSTGSEHTGLEIAYNIIEESSTQIQIEGTNTHWHHNIFRNWNLFNQSQNTRIDLFDNKCSPISYAPAGTIIENNIFYNISTPGIQITHYYNSTIIQNNIFYNCGTGMLTAGVEGSYIGRGISLAFIAWGTTTDFTPSLDAIVKNNMFFDDTLASGYDCVVTGGRSSTLGTGRFWQKFNITELANANYPNWTRTDNTENQPNFNNLVDYRLGSGSPAIGTGIIPTTPLNDYDGILIEQGSIGTGYDIGLYNQE